MKVYVDGENCRHGIANILKELGIIAHAREISSFNLRRLLEDALDNQQLDISYYTSKIKLPHGFEPSAEMLSKAQLINEANRKWTANLVDQNITHVKAGYLKVKTTDPCPNCQHRQEVLQEKGVDVRIAVDLVTDPRIGSDNTIAILSSDSDLIPALNKLKESGVRVIYVCFASYLNRAISSVAHETVAISTAKVKRYYSEEQ